MENRKLAVLRAIVEDYVQTHEPVGSKALADRHSLGVSSATIRNDMAALEDEGLISAPHTSAGRIPTDKGYRVFVDKLNAVKPMSPAEKRAIQSFLDQAVDLDDVMNRTARLLAQLTKQVALVQYPILGRSSVRHIELVQVAPSKILLIVITDTGRIEQRNVDTGLEVDESFMNDLRQRLNSQLAGQHLGDVPSRLSGIEQHFDMSVRPAVAQVVTTLMESVLNQNEERIVIGGTSHLARLADDSPEAMVPMLEALEEQMVLLKLFGETVLPDALQVRIGAENSVEEFQSSSVVTVGYGSGDQALATLGVLGPTRMDYSNSMSSVQAVAMYVGKILADQ